MTVSFDPIQRVMHRIDGGGGGLQGGLVFKPAVLLSILALITEVLGGIETAVFALESHVKSNNGLEWIVCKKTGMYNALVLTLSSQETSRIGNMDLAPAAPG